MSNPLNNYKPFDANTTIGFKLGSQTALNALIASGSAVEGTFYLTQDTHKLYVGRKIQSGSRANQIVPEQVSRGVTIVKDTGDLNTVPAGAQEEGELYYITGENILAALVKDTTNDSYKWVQVNPGTGITGLTLETDLDNNILSLREEIVSQNGTTTGSTSILYAGNNISMSVINNIPTISAENTTYSPGVITSTNNGIIGLKINNNTAVSTTSTITFVGDSGIGLSSDASNSSVILKSTTLQTLTIDADEGFKIDLNFTPGNSTVQTSISAVLNPTINYGKNHTISASFNSGQANLDVYSTTQTDNAIEEAIKKKLATADALSYKGAVTSPTDLRNKIIENKAHVGDVYKATADILIEGINIKRNDLIILSDADQAASIDSTSNTITISGKLITTETPNTDLIKILDIIPAGDEPIYLTQYSEVTDPQIIIADSTVSNNVLLDLSFVGGNAISVTNGSTTAAQITINHAAISTTYNTTATITTAIEETSANMANNYQFFALSPSSSNGYGIKTDNWGHVTNLYGQVITLTHNKLKGLTTDYDNTGVRMTIQDSMTSVVGIISFTSQNLTISPSGDALGINLFWSSF